eukprot:scaffold5543_cov196-Prasinococcus_capsulatus_cf.AAC.2
MAARPATRAPRRRSATGPASSRPGRWRSARRGDLRGTCALLGACRAASAAAASQLRRRLLPLLLLLLLLLGARRAAAGAAALGARRCGPPRARRAPHTYAPAHTSAPLPPARRGARSMHEAPALVAV